MIIPIIFATLWTIICCKARKQDGDYGAPPGMMYNQQKAELQKFYKMNMSNHYSEESTRDQEYQPLSPNNLNMLNQDEYEEPHGSEDLDKCNMFDKDMDKMPLF